MAIACFRLVTFFPLRPDFNFPCFMAFISRSTALDALGLYFRPLDFFLELLLVVAMECTSLYGKPLKLFGLRKK